MIPETDLLIENWPIHSGRPGGQHFGSGPSGVSVTHLPSGVVACVSIGRSQHTNREIAINMIEAAITHPRYR